MCINLLPLLTCWGGVVVAKHFKLHRVCMNDTWLDAYLYVRASEGHSCALMHIGMQRRLDCCVRGVGGLS